MKSLAVIRPGDLRDKNPETGCIIDVIEKEEPQICGPTEVKIKVAYCAICASDPHVALNIFNRTPPYGLGHEISGVIVDMGSEVNTKGLKIGDRVAGNFLRACGRCYHCQNGHPEFCRHAIDEQYLLLGRQQAGTDGRPGHARQLFNILQVRLYR